MIAKLKSSSLLRAFFLMLLVYAAIHTVVMVVYTLTTGDYQTLNSFRILGFTLFFPGLDRDPVLFYVSGIIPVILFSAAYRYITRQR